MIGKPTLKDILELSINEPVVYTAIHYWRENLCTFEEAMMISVIALAEQKNILSRQNVELTKWSVKPLGVI